MKILPMGHEYKPVDYSDPVDMMAEELLQDYPNAGDYAREVAYAWAERLLREEEDLPNFLQEQLNRRKGLDCLRQKIETLKDLYRKQINSLF